MLVVFDRGLCGGLRKGGVYRLWGEAGDERSRSSTKGRARNGFVLRNRRRNVA